MKASKDPRFQKFKKNIKSIEDVVLLLSKVEVGEDRLLQIIFDGKAHEAANIRKELVELKEHFKLCCESILNEMHKDDWNDINKSMVTELDKHFTFWGEKIGLIHSEAVAAMQRQEKIQQRKERQFHELQHNMHSLMPKSMKPIEDIKEKEKILLNMNQQKDALHMRIQGTLARDRLISTAQRDRKLKMTIEKKNLKSHLHEDEKDLFFMIQDTLNKAIAKRRQEFERYAHLTQFVAQVQEGDPDGDQPAPQGELPAEVPGGA